MKTADLRPSTVDAVKQLAKKIKRERNISHTEALDLASRQGGFENFVHARRRLAPSQSTLRMQPSNSTRVVPVYLSANWRDVSGPSGSGRVRAGRELLCVELSKAATSIVSKHAVRMSRGLQGFLFEYEDHLEHRFDVMSMDGARKVLSAAARTFRFMDATGLKPATTAKQRSSMQVVSGLPGRDHHSYWVDPASGGWIVLDEPYDDALTRLHDERAAWLAGNGLHWERPPWGGASWDGLYLPRDCRPCFISADRGLLQRVVVAVSVLPAHVEPDPWPHEASVYGDDFISPRRVEDGKPRKPRAKASYLTRMGATTYGGGPGERSMWRPDSSLPVPTHRRLGALMQALTVSSFTSRSYNKLLRLRMTLQEWATEEHKREHGNLLGDEMYYGTRVDPLQTAIDKARAVAEARGIVLGGYDECRPRSEVVAILDAVAAEIERFHR